MEVVGSPIKFNYAATSLMYYVTSKRLFLLKIHIQKKKSIKKEAKCMYINLGRLY